MLDNSRIESFNYLKLLVHKYQSRGWNAYSNILERQENLPMGWTGAEPDVLFINNERSIAVCVESLFSLNDDNISEKWKEILQDIEVQHPQKPETSVRLKVKLVVLTSDKKTLEFAKRIAKAHLIPVDCQIIKKVARRRKKKKKYFFREKTKLEKLIILFGILLLMGFIYVASYYTISYIKTNFKIKDYYQPFDGDRINKVID